MGKYLVLWEVDQTKIPDDPEERGIAWGLFMGMIQEDMEKGLTRDWGEFVGQTNGYAINEGTESDVMLSLAQYTPYCTFKVHPVATEGQVVEMIKALYG